jgi:hypothetical protein
MAEYKAETANLQQGQMKDRLNITIGIAPAS